MNTKYPHQHILENLLHEQIMEIVPILLPGFQVKQALDIELPDLKITELDEPPTEFDKGIVGLALPGAKVLKRLHSEWIEHSGEYARTYRVTNTETDKPTYLLIEFQIERDDENFSRRFLRKYVRVNLYASEDVAQLNETMTEEEKEHQNTTSEQEYYVYPYALCSFPQSIPAHFKSEFMGKPIMSFNFLYINLWEKDAREVLNAHATSAYFLLPAMKNADANLLGLAIEELAQRFKNNDKELGRHVTGLSLMLQQSEAMSDEEKQHAQEYLIPFTHLIKTDPYED